MNFTREILKDIFTKVLSVLLLIAGTYHFLLSSLFILFIYPRSLGTHKFIPFTLQESLIEKALVLYFTTIIEGIYGLSLLIRPREKVSVLHLLAGIAIFIFSIFFITQTRLTTDPLLVIFKEVLKKNN